MASKKITELLALTQATPDDLLPIVDDPSGTPITKKITISNFFGNVQPTVVFANSVTFRTTSQFNDDVILLHSLAVNGTVTFTNTLSTTGNVIFGNTLSVASNAVLQHITVNAESQFNDGFRSGSNDAHLSNVSFRIGNSAANSIFLRANGIVNASMMVSVGGNVNISTSNLSIGNTTANASVNSTSFTLNGNVAIYAGSATTRNAVRTQVGTSGANGSIYLSTAGKMYLKVNIAGADTDWQKVTTTAAD